MHTQIQAAVKRRFGIPFAGAKFTLDLDRHRVVVDGIRQEQAWVIKADGQFLLYLGDNIEGYLYRGQTLPCPSFDAGHLAERCQAIKALLGLEVEIRNHRLLPLKSL
jgi:hypothetical protein